MSVGLPSFFVALMRLLPGGMSRVLWMWQERELHFPPGWMVLCVVPPPTTIPPVGLVWTSSDIIGGIG